MEKIIGIFCDGGKGSHIIGYVHTQAEAEKLIKKYIILQDEFERQLKSVLKEQFDKPDEDKDWDELQNKVTQLKTDFSLLFGFPYQNNGYMFSSQHLQLLTI